METTSRVQEALNHCVQLERHSIAYGQPSVHNTLAIELDWPHLFASLRFYQVLRACPTPNPRRDKNRAAWMQDRGFQTNQKIDSFTCYTTRHVSR